MSCGWGLYASKRVALHWLLCPQHLHPGGKEPSAEGGQGIRRAMLTRSVGPPCSEH